MPGGFLGALAALHGWFEQGGLLLNTGTLALGRMRLVCTNMCVQMSVFSPFLPVLPVAIQRVELLPEPPERRGTRSGSAWPQMP